MGYYWRPYQQIIDDFFEWLFADKREKKMIQCVPRSCRNCHVLNICRDESNNWKCINGCRFIDREPINYDIPIKINNNILKLFRRKKPVKRVVIAGSRTFKNYKKAKKYIDIYLSNIRKENEIIIVSGGASGSDAIGELYAKRHGLTIERYMANWDKYGKSAGPRRNKKMAEICDYVICFWDGKSAGTKSMIGYAKKYRKPLRIKRI